MRWALWVIACVAAGWLNAHAAIESYILRERFSELTVEEDGLRLTLRPDSLGMAIITEGEIPTRAAAGERIFVPFGKGTTVANRNIQVQFEPVGEGTDFDITYRIDHRSAGGELEVVGEVLVTANAAMGEAFQLSEETANSSQEAINEEMDPQAKPEPGKEIQSKDYLWLWLGLVLAALVIWLFRKGSRRSPNGGT